MKHYESISEYNDPIYDFRPVKLDDYISNKYNIVHNELYNDALNKFLKEYVSKRISYNFIYDVFDILNQYINNENYYYFGYSEPGDNILIYNEKNIPIGIGPDFKFLTRYRNRCPINFKEPYYWPQNIESHIYVIVPKNYYDPESNTYYDDKRQTYTRKSSTSGIARLIQMGDDNNPMCYSFEYNGIEYWVFCITEEGITEYDIWEKNIAISGDTDYETYDEDINDIYYLNNIKKHFNYMLDSKSLIVNTLNKLEISKSDFINIFLKTLNNIYKYIYNLIYNHNTVNSDRIENINSIIKLIFNNIDNVKIQYIGYYAYISSLNYYTKEGYINLLSIDNNFNRVDILINKDFEFIILVNNEYFYQTLEEEKLINDIKYNKLDSFMNMLINNIIEIFIRSHKFIEIKNTEYWMPSDVLIIHNIKPFTKHKYSLEDYWNYYQKYNTYNIDDIKITNENIKDSHISDINYVNGTAEMYSKSTNIKFNVPFKYLNKDTEISDDLLLLNTFTSKIL